MDDEPRSQQEYNRQCRQSRSEAKSRMDGAIKANKKPTKNGGVIGANQGPLGRCTCDASEGMQTMAIGAMEQRACL
eukprot:616728-Pelagomonas_calceolata.AAC.5